MRLFAVLAATGFFIVTTALSPSAWADDPPILQGQWRTEQSIVSYDNKGKPHFFDKVSISNIDVQNGRRFSGIEYQGASGNKNAVGGDRFIGVISADNTSLYMVTGTGFIDCHIMSKDHLDCVYRNQTAKQSASAVMTWRRASQ
ncbi:MAG: hypothetical protein AAGI44_01970 [Pseudomonadota bacterium]